MYQYQPGKTLTIIIKSRSNLTIHFKIGNNVYLSLPSRNEAYARRHPHQWLEGVQRDDRLTVCNRVIARAGERSTSCFDFGKVETFTVALQNLMMFVGGAGGEMRVRYLWVDHYYTGNKAGDRNTKDKAVDRSVWFLEQVKFLRGQKRGKRGGKRREGARRRRRDDK